jgi:hypothetical protein
MYHRGYERITCHADGEAAALGKHQAAGRRVAWYEPEVTPIMLVVTARRNAVTSISRRSRAAVAIMGDVSTVGHRVARVT